MGRGLLGSTLGLLAGRLTQPLFAFLLFFASARLLTVSEFGLYVLLMGLAVLFQSLSSLGLGPVLAREIGRDPEGEGGAVGAALFLTVPASLAGYALFVLLALGLKGYGDFVALSAIVAAGVPFSCLLILAESVFTAHNRGDFLFYVNLAEQGGRLAMGVGALAAGWGLYGLAVTYVVGRVLAAAAAAILFRRARLGPPIRLDRGRVRAMAEHLKVFAPMTFLANLYFRTDVIMMAWLTAEDELGWYGCAMRVVTLGFLGPESVVTASFPHVSARWARGDADFGERMTRALTFLVAWGLAGAAAMAVFAAFFLTPVFGDRYAAAVPLLGVLAFMLPAHGLNTQLGLLLQAVGRERTALAVTAACLALVVAGTGFGAVWGGAAGVALGVLLTTWLGALVHLAVTQPSLYRLPWSSPLYRALGVLTVAAVGLACWRPDGDAAFCLTLAGVAAAALVGGGLSGELRPDRVRRVLS